jgi:hypothetical protein
VIVQELGEYQAAARVLGLNVITSEIRQVTDIALAIDALKGDADALYVCQDLLTFSNWNRITTLTLGARLPTMQASRESIEAAGLISYGPSFPDLSRRAADYVDKILRGAKPADLPVEQPTKFETRHQPDNREGSGSHHLADPARPRRRGDRVRQAQCDSRRGLLTSPRVERPLPQNDPNRTDHSASQSGDRACIRRLLRLVEFAST